MIEYFGNFVKVYTRYGMGFSSRSEELFYQWLQDGMIDNLTYIEAIDALKKLKETY